MPYEVVHAADIYSRKEGKNYANTSGAYELGAGVVLHKSNQIEPNRIRVQEHLLKLIWDGRFDSDVEKETANVKLSYPCMTKFS